MQVETLVSENPYVDVRKLAGVK